MKKKVGLNIPVSIICLIRISDLIVQVNKQMTIVDRSGIQPGISSVISCFVCFVSKRFRDSWVKPEMAADTSD